MNNPATPERNLHDYVLVDEYQDLNKAEQSVIDLLCDAATLCIMGDDDQSLYSFKFVHPAGIRELPAIHQLNDRPSNNGVPTMSYSQRADASFSKRGSHISASANWELLVSGAQRVIDEAMEGDPASALALQSEQSSPNLGFSSHFWGLFKPAFGGVADPRLATTW
jgi:hypothetical protein